VTPFEKVSPLRTAVPQLPGAGYFGEMFYPAMFWFGVGIMVEIFVRVVDGPYDICYPSFDLARPGQWSGSAGGAARPLKFFA